MLSRTHSRIGILWLEVRDVNLAPAYRRLCFGLGLAASQRGEFGYIDAVMSEFLNLLAVYHVYGLSAFAIALLATPVAMRVARRFNVMDHPDEFLKPHSRPTPYLGGAAICLGWALALALGLAGGAVEWRLLVPVLLGGLAISFMGLVDDIGGIRPKLRLLLLAAIVAAVLLATGAGERLVDSVLGPLGWPGAVWPRRRSPC